MVDALTGEHTKVLNKVRGGSELSPAGRYIVWWDGSLGQWRTLDTATRKPASLTAAVPYGVQDEANDQPGPPEPYGLGGWTEGDARALVYDRFDVWSVDPTGASAPVNVTAGTGRTSGIRFRLASVEGGPDVAAGVAPQVVPASGALLLSALDTKTRDAGFWADRVEGGEPRKLVMSAHHYGVPVRAAAADRVMLTRESFSEYPDLWVASGAFVGLTRVSQANPQQTEFKWGTEELVAWTSGDGKPLKGIVYKPQDFDPKKRYPVIVQLYERATDDFHRYHDPSPEGASINRSFYVSQGYVVFAPDITYEVGKPGESLIGAVVPGVKSMVASGVADEARIGVQGHSWGGWEAAFLVTRTDLFAAAIAGAPVANMTSAYGGVRWGSGMSRMFQYEQEQSRIGGTLWNQRASYIENSPLFSADRVRTPLLILHNDGDDSVPWEQGIELFSALRRLGKPAWMVDYNGEMHSIHRAANRRDWAIRMQQFFDHYLRDQAPPVWMVEGIPATQKGRTLGLDLVEPEGTPMTDASGGASVPAPRPAAPAGRTPARATSPVPAAPNPRP
jgi:acetyl esterase/lipase